MKVTIKHASDEVVSLEKFADDHNLEMSVVERHKRDTTDRYYACFKGVEVVVGNLRIGAYGDGQTPMDAIRNYACSIAGKAISIDGETIAVKAPRRLFVTGQY